VYDPFLFGRVWFYPREIGEEQISRMKRAASYIIGKRDFAAFMSEGSDVEDTVRRVNSLSIMRSGDFVDVRISADGFLYNMVRIIVGTLVETAFGRFSPDEMPNIIASCDRARAGMTAPAEGLYLNSVKY
jgi:tRNA pseudouridine38-40 synthase